MKGQGLKALVFGGTGAVGMELVASLLASSKWSKVHCVARRQLPRWNELPGKEKLTVDISQNLMNYFTSQHKDFENFSSLFCCLGSHIKYGEQTFKRVDKTYPLLAADLALANNIPHYLFLSSMGGNNNSWFLYPRIKGQAQHALKLKKLNLLSIFKPGLLRHRRNARMIERIFSLIPIAPGIEAIDCALVLKETAERYHQEALTSKSKVQVFENKDMLRQFIDARQK